jgi:phosphonate transport system substrate-binding protein
MMSGVYQMTVSPDFPTKRMSGWFIFNTWLQKALDLHIHLELYANFADQRGAIAADKVDLIYANPFDAAMLVREKGFVPVARPAGKSDECIVIVASGSPVQTIEDLRSGCRVASTDDPDVNLVGMIMLEPADLDGGNTQRIKADSYPLVAKALMRGEADVGFFLEEAYEELSKLVRKELRPLVHSQVDDISHVLLVGPRLAQRYDDVRRVILGMAGETRSADVLAELGFAAWEPMSKEDTEFMIDLMDTLKA